MLRVLAVLALILLAAVLYAAPVNTTCTIQDAEQPAALRWRTEENARRAAMPSPPAALTQAGAASELLRRQLVEVKGQQEQADADSSRSKITSAKAWIDHCATLSAQTKSDACAVTPSTASSTAVCLCP